MDMNYEMLIRAAIFGAAYVRAREHGEDAGVARRFAAATLAQYMMLPTVSMVDMLREAEVYIRERAAEMEHQAKKDREGAS